jgi:hypothetical protein
LPKRLSAIWLCCIAGFAFASARAIFPTTRLWYGDWAKYTDEGWYGNAAIRAHLFGNWYLPGDFNPAPAVPVWPFLEWVLFFFTGVTVEAARGLAVAFFFANLMLSYLLLQDERPALDGAAGADAAGHQPLPLLLQPVGDSGADADRVHAGCLNLAVRLPRMRRPVWASVWIGLLFTLMMLTKTTAVFLLPALGWAMVLPLWQDAQTCAALRLGRGYICRRIWSMDGAVIGFGLMRRLQILFFVNKYIKPTEFYWPLVSLWWSFHGGLWIDRILVPLAGVDWRWARARWRGAAGDGVCCLTPSSAPQCWAVAGYILFMTYQNHPQPRYFARGGLLLFLCGGAGS